MTDRSARPRGVAVFPMPEEVGGPAVFGQYALLVRDNATTGLQARMVHTEGVAYLVTAEKPWCWTDYDPNQRVWTITELIDLAAKIDPVDLADWVRSFGARLESNFHQAYWWANQD